MIEHTDDVPGRTLARRAQPPAGALTYPATGGDRRAQIAYDLHLPMLAALALMPGWAARLQHALAGAVLPAVAVDAPSPDEARLLDVLARGAIVSVTPLPPLAPPPCEPHAAAVAAALGELADAADGATAAEGLRRLHAACRRAVEKTPLDLLREGDAAAAEQAVSWHAPQTAWWLMLAAEHHDAGDHDAARRLFAAALARPSLPGGREAIAWLAISLARLSPGTAMGIGLRVYGSSYASDAVLRLAPVLADADAVREALEAVSDPEARAAATETAATWLAEHGWPDDAMALVDGLGPLSRSALPLVEALLAQHRPEAAEAVAARLPAAVAERALLAISEKVPAAAARIATPALRARALAAHDDRAALDALAEAHDEPATRVACAAVAARRGDADAAERRAWALEAVSQLEDPRQRAVQLTDLGTAADLLEAARLASRLDGWDARPLLDQIVSRLVASERWEEARAVDALQERPELRLAETRVSLALARIGRFAEARAALDKVARLQFDAGDAAGARITLERALQAAAASPDEIGRLTALVHVAGALRHCGRLEEARAALRRCVSEVDALPARYVSLGTQLPLELVRCGLEREALDMAERLSGDRMVVEVAARLPDHRRARDVVARLLRPASAPREEGRSLGDLLALFGGSVQLDPDLADLFPSPSRDLASEVRSLLRGEPGDLVDVLRHAASVGDGAAVRRLLPLAAADEALVEAALDALHRLG